ncbi:NAD(P)-dependent oxidoreductase [Clostridium kluyveri]|uniref:GyaR n=1 Tax=Clostridium kluyveri (strain ATCC 8527 / DSM 555 / NBRC 12016 / NCIMB 10680 / K1) TaxID=431943 RepID=A5N6P2_CLOK5|nr:NAD(P)-dependent oxidoreductase [Clostridium kluyveri]EDK32973.1 GyaR [Clostridium kluyveri DSM 555]
MKILIIGSKDRYLKYMPNIKFVQDCEKVYIPRDYSQTEILDQAKNVNAIIIDAIAKLPEKIIVQMPNLKIIQSEGVAYNGIDCRAAKQRGIYVCNCKGANASSVAEQTILLMLALLRSMVIADRIEREGYQIELKEHLMLEGITELGDCRIGLIGFGDIAKATAKRLAPFGCKIFYYTKRPKSHYVEKEFQVSYLGRKELISSCDIVSIHCPVTPETTGMVNTEFLSHMKHSSYLINTARGEIVDNQALYNAIVSEQISGAGLDTVYPEPTTKDNVLLNLPGKYAERIIFSPHIGGITTSFFRRAHAFVWNNVAKALKGERPEFIVNGL